MIEPGDNTNEKGLVEGEHYYFNKDGLWVFTEKYHLLRGYCCNSNCLHCPYKANEPGVQDNNPGR